VCCFSANVQIPLFGLPQGKSLGPHEKDQELNPRPHTPRPAALPVKVEQKKKKKLHHSRVGGVDDTILCHFISEHVKANMQLTLSA